MRSRQNFHRGHVEMLYLQHLNNLIALFLSLHITKCVKTTSISLNAFFLSKFLYKF